MIQFENVSFNYDNSEKILNDINLTINDSEVICLLVHQVAVKPP